MTRRAQRRIARDTVAVSAASHQILGVISGGFSA